MYFKAVGRITKECENPGPNGPLYIFREGSHPSPQRDTGVKISSSEVAVFSIVN